MFLQQARKQKLKIRIAKKQKHCILPCFWPVGCENSRSEKCPKHRCLQCFVFPPKTKQRYVRCFPTLNTPKWSRNNGIYDVFAMFSAPTKDKTTLFTMFSFSRNPKIEPKHRYLRCFCNTKKSQRSQNTAICVTFTTPHMENAVFYSVFEPPLQKHWYLRCFEKLLA